MFTIMVGDASWIRLELIGLVRAKSTTAATTGVQ
jgi:hypothetical protein